MTYTVHLISLKCVISQEDEGDEIYITLNGQRVWSVWADYKLNQRPSRPHHINEVDFVEGRLLLRDGWQPMPDFDPADFIFTDQSGLGRFEVWDQDNFSRDDYFGNLPFSENEAGHGNITGVAARDGAHYVMTYKVVMDAT
jgi:hypothetical protein